MHEAGRINGRSVMAPLAVPVAHDAVDTLAVLALRRAHRGTRRGVLARRTRLVPGSRRVPVGVEAQLWRTKAARPGHARVYGRHRFSMTHHKMLRERRARVLHADDEQQARSRVVRLFRARAGQQRERRGAPQHRGCPSHYAIDASL